MCHQCLRVIMAAMQLWQWLLGTQLCGGKSYLYSHLQILRCYSKALAAAICEMFRVEKENCCFVAKKVHQGEEG